MVPFAPILQEGEQPFAMFVDLQRKYDWVLDVIRYPSVERLIEGLEDKMVRRAEAKFNHLLTRRTKQLRVEIELFAPKLLTRRGAADRGKYREVATAAIEIGEHRGHRRINAASPLPAAVVRRATREAEEDWSR
jgi:hypothetical protein